MNIEKLLEAYGLDELKFLKLLEHVTIAELEDDFCLRDPYLFNEQRLYESLGKEDARTVLAEHRMLRTVQILLRMRLDGKEPWMDEVTKVTVQSAIEVGMRHVELYRKDKP